MRKICVMLVATSALFAAYSAYAAEDTEFNSIDVTIYTVNDNKDDSDGVILKLMLDNQIRDSTIEFGEGITYHDNSINHWHWNLQWHFHRNECPRMALLVEKTKTDKGWFANFEVKTNDGTIMLSPTRDSNGNVVPMLFGRRMEINLLNILMNSRQQVVHQNGPNQWEIKFNRCS